MSRVNDEMEFRQKHARGIVMLKKILGRVLIVSGVAILIILFTFQAFSADISIVDVRRNIPLSDEAPVYKDYYLNGGTAEGLKRNQVVNVVRKMTIRDFSGAQSYGELEVVVGQIKIIALNSKVSVAREYKLIPRDEEPMLEQIGIMNGDRLDFEGSFVDNKKTSAK